MNARDRLIVALDVPRADAARALVDRLAGRVGMFKVGSQVFTAAGPDLVREIVAGARRSSSTSSSTTSRTRWRARSRARARGSACRSSTSTASAAGP